MMDMEGAMWSLTPATTSRNSSRNFINQGVILGNFSLRF